MYLASRRSAITMLFQVIQLIFNSDNYNKLSIFTPHKTNINFFIQKRAIYQKVHRKPWKHSELLQLSYTPYISVRTLQFIHLSIHPISSSYLTFFRLFARNAIGKYLAIIPSVIDRIKSFRILLKRIFALFMAYQ